MANPLKPNPLIAVDTNVPLDLAEEKEHALDALGLIRRRLKHAQATPAWNSGLDRL